MHWADAQHFMLLRRKSGAEAPRTLHRFRINLAALESVVVSVLCLWLLCTLDPPKKANIEIASFYVLLSSVLGGFNFWVFAPRLGRSFGLRTIRLASSWAVIPPAVLLLRADSRLCVFAGILMGLTFVLAMAERRDFKSRASLEQQASLQFQLFQPEAFSALPPWTTLLLSLLFFAMVFAAVCKWLLPAMLLGAVSAAMAGFRWASYYEENAVFRGSMAHQAKRSGVIALASIAITSMLLMPRQVQEAQAADWRAVQSLLKVLKGPADHPARHAVHAATNAEMAGVPEIFLWPKPPLKTHALIAPPTADKARVIQRSLVIPFNGPYIYTEESEAGLRTKPLVAHGSPLKAKVESVDGSPISMVARQRLTPAIEVASCGAIQVTIRRVAPETATALGVIMSNTVVPRGAPLSLVTQQLKPDVSRGVGVTEQTLTFPLPAGAKLRTFDEIKVLVLRKPAMVQRGAHVEIEHFTLLPR